MLAPESGPQRVPDYLAGGSQARQKLHGSKTTVRNRQTVTYVPSAAGSPDLSFHLLLSQLLLPLSSTVLSS